MVDHAGYILSWTRSFVGTASDRTICKFDYFFTALQTLALYTTYEYGLYDSAGNIILMTALMEDTRAGVACRVGTSTLRTPSIRYTHGQ